LIWCLMRAGESSRLMRSIGKNRGNPKAGKRLTGEG
jgi:hypothetical protein